MPRRMPELMGSAEARALIPPDVPLPFLRRDLACDTIYLAADVRALAKRGTVGRRRTMPELMGAKEAAACLGVQVPNLAKLSGVSGVPQQQTPRGTIYLADGIRALKARRDAPAPPRSCAKHGEGDMRISAKSGKRWCAACGRERKAALLKDSVRRERYNRQRRERYREQQETEVAA